MENDSVNAVSSVLGINFQKDALLFRGQCSILFDRSALSLEKITAIIAVDFVQPVIDERIFLRESILINRLCETNGRLILYWLGTLVDLNDYEHYWQRIEPGQSMEPVVVLVENFKLFEKDQLSENPWQEVFNIRFNHIQEEK